MTERKYTLVEMIRAPMILVCEASELTEEGHYYLYRYNGSEASFYRATVPSGAADVHFRVLEPTDKIPLGGWEVIETNDFTRANLKLVSKKEKHSIRATANHERKGLVNNKRD
jgi:hypothetical protein